MMHFMGNRKIGHDDLLSYVGNGLNDTFSVPLGETRYVKSNTSVAQWWQQYDHRNDAQRAARIPYYDTPT